MKNATKVPPAWGLVRGFALTGVLLFAAAGAFAQQPVVADKCSPEATEVLNSKSIPAAPTPFGGVIKKTAPESKPCWDPKIVPPKGAPNILLIMTDDSGFGVPSTF